MAALVRFHLQPPLGGKQMQTMIEQTQTEPATNSILLLPPQIDGWLAGRSTRKFSVGKVGSSLAKLREQLREEESKITILKRHPEFGTLN